MAIATPAKRNAAGMLLAILLAACGGGTGGSRATALATAVDGAGGLADAGATQPADVAEIPDVPTPSRDTAAPVADAEPITTADVAAPAPDAPDAASTDADAKDMATAAVADTAEVSDVGVPDAAEVPDVAEPPPALADVATGEPGALDAGSTDVPELVDTAVADLDELPPPLPDVIVSDVALALPDLPDVIDVGDLVDPVTVDVAPDVAAAGAEAAPELPEPAADAAADAVTETGAPGGYQLVWSDEFDAPVAAPPDPTRWNIDVGNDGPGAELGWGNNELEFYTAGAENVRQEGGFLLLTARKDNVAGLTCWNGPCAYTSGRINSQGKFTAQYGRIEARIQVPGAGKGLWPAWWMLGHDFPIPTDWPACGEIDVMETVGSEPSSVSGTLHGPGYSDDAGITQAYSRPDQASFANDFHVYAIEWQQGVVRFLVDDVPYQCVVADLALSAQCGDVPVKTVPAGTQWVFDQPFYLVLNLAVGGSWPGSPSSFTVFPAQMRVDWVRVYQKP